MPAVKKHFDTGAKRAAIERALEGQGPPKVMKQLGMLKGLSHQILRLFYDLQLQICTFCVGADGF